MIANIKKVFEKDFEDITEDKSPSSCDIIYVDSTMCQERRFQPMFRIRSDLPNPTLQMYSHILRRDGTHSIESMQITSWPAKEDSTNSECYWSGHENHSTLVLSEPMFERFLPRYCHSTMKCNLCRMEYNKSKNSVTRSKGVVVKKADTPMSRQYTCLYNQDENVRQKRKITYPLRSKNYTKVKNRKPAIKRKRSDKEFWICRSYNEE